MTWRIMILRPTPSQNTRECRPIFEIVNIPGIPGYGITRDGKVFSKLIPLKKGIYSEHWKEMSYGSDVKGYLRCQMRFNGKSRAFRVHRLVACAFIGLIPEGMTVNHMDGNKKNNNWENLEIVTNRENILHSYQTGMRKGCMPKGQNSKNAKLTEDQAIEILMLRRFRIDTTRNIAAQYGITEALVYLINKGKNWSHLCVGF